MLKFNIIGLKTHICKLSLTNAKLTTTTGGIVRHKQFCCASYV